MKHDERKEEHVAEPINDAAEHLNKIIGVPNRKVVPSQLPLPIRIFYYVVTAFMILGLLLMVLIQIFK